MVRRGTGLHTDQARRQGLKKCHHLAAPELLPDNDLLVGVDAVDLKHVLGDIQTDRGNLHLDGSPHVIRHNDHSMALRCRERAPSTTSSADSCSAAKPTLSGRIVARTGLRMMP